MEVQLVASRELSCSILLEISHVVRQIQVERNPENMELFRTSAMHAAIAFGALEFSTRFYPDGDGRETDALVRAALEAMAEKVNELIKERAERN